MLLSQVSFETLGPAPPDDPVRMDGACFIGLCAERRPVAAGPALAAWLERAGYLTAAEKAAGPVTLHDRPVPVRSFGEFEALFDTGARLDRPAEVTSLPLPATFAPADPAAPLTVVVDGALAEIALGAAATPAAVAAAVNAAGQGVEARLAVTAGEVRLVVGLPAAHGPGTLAVLAHPALGFPEARHARARAVPTVLAVALRQFFAMDGRLAHVISLGPALPLLAPRAERVEALGRLMGLGAIPAEHVALRLGEPLPAPHAPVASLSGLTHLLALDGPAMLLMPDLPDLTAAAREPPAEPAPVPPARPVFSECLPPAAPAFPSAVTAAALPEADTEGLALWRGAVDRTLGLITAHRRDLHLIAAVPRAARGGAVAAALPDSAFLLLAGPFLRTPASEGLPQRAMPACSVLAGRIAATLTGSAPYASAAAAAPEAVTAPAEPPGPAAWPVSWIVTSPRGPLLSRDITASRDPDWRPGIAGRIMARLVREAAVMGQDLVFEPIDRRLMRRVVVGFERILGAVAAAGGLRAEGRDRGYDVVCDRTLMTDADIEAGILRAEITFRPAATIDAIRVVLPVGPMRGGAR